MSRTCRSQKDLTLLGSPTTAATLPTDQHPWGGVSNLPQPGADAGAPVVQGTITVDLTASAAPTS
ncbi:MAG: hypothetical protein U1F37_03710 [Alphaproteobacteria bacterium]